MAMGNRFVPNLTLILSALTLVCIFSIAAFTLASITSPQPSWSKTYSGDHYDYGSCLRQTADNGFIICGGSSQTANGGGDAGLIKVDGDGNLKWQRAYGGDKSDYGHSVIEPLGGGYVMAGNTESFGNGSSDVYLIRTDADGNPQWEKTYGGKDADEGLAMAQASDGGYIIAGSTRSFGNGGSDIYLVKTNTRGDLQWEKTYGGTYDDVATAIEHARDGGYIISGHYGVGEGQYEPYLLKIDALGNMQWDMKLDTVITGIAYQVRQTRDRGYIAAGYTTPSSGNSELLIFKTDNNGTVQWKKILNDYPIEKSYSIFQAPDGGYILAGIAGIANKSSTGGNDAKYEGLLVKTDSQGNVSWQKTFGADSDVFLRSGVLTGDGGAALTGSIGTKDDVVPRDVYLLKLNGVWK